MCTFTEKIACSFCEGDLLTELQQVDDQWIWARLEKNAQSGLVAVHLTVPLNDKRIPPEELPYFHEGTVDELARRLNAYNCVVHVSDVLRDNKLRCVNAEILIASRLEYLSEAIEKCQRYAGIGVCPCFRRLLE
uniref:Uncharacterized protein n=1 Tax=Parascaris equorum TaxID=6256 RepID=A0A914RNZ4_PAREQ